MKQLFTLILAIILIVYPVGIYFGIEYKLLSNESIAAILASLFLFRIFLMKDAGIHILRQLLPICVIVVITSGLVFVFDDPVYLMVNPALISYVLLCCFAYSVLRPPTVIARLAAIQFPDLPQVAVEYCRKVTLVWCGFFMVNGSVSLATALYGNMKIWALYNGLISYVLMGLIFAVEYYFRRQNIKTFDEEMAREQAEKST